MTTSPQMSDRSSKCLDCGQDTPHHTKRCPTCCAAEHKKLLQAIRQKKPNMSEKLAAALLLLMKVPREVAKTMTVEAILSSVQWDHYPVAVHIARDLGWTVEQTNHPSNLQPLLPEDHAHKTAMIDTPQAAKGKRLSSAHEDFRRKMLAPGKAVETRNKSKKKLQGQGFQGHRKMDGTPVFKNREFK